VTSAASEGKILVLSARDAAYVREALLAAADVFAAAVAAGGAGFKALADAALDAGHPLARVHYQACLAVDYIDFPMPVRDPR
jgi:hypothetical protein